MLHDIEYIATLATIKDKAYKYPKKDIDDIWENTLLCQFHDCLPGSAIEMCYRDSDELYEYGFKTGEKLMKDALSVLDFSRHDSKGGSLAAVNTLPWARADIVELLKPNTLGNAQYGLAQGGSGVIGVVPLQTKNVKAGVSIKEIRRGVFQLANAHYKVEVEGGSIVSLFDLAADREVIAKGAKANQLVIFDDKPNYWQAWDVEVFHLETRKELPAGTSQIVEQSPYKVSLMTETKISEQSWIKTTISLAASIEDQPSYVEMTSEVEWRETMRFLKVEFPVDIVNTEASYETQYGIIRRPTHYNTSWDMAKFEVCCHKWADLSEHGYGVSILNDSKYGFATSGNMMRLSLLRAPKAPDAHADMGKSRQPLPSMIPQTY